MTDLRSLPRDRILAALNLPTNASPAAQKALRDALRRQAPKDTSIPANVAQRGTSEVAGVRTADGGLLVTLPLPPKALSPNARVHWRTKARFAQEYRTTAKVAALLSIGRRAAPRWERATVQAMFYFPVHRRRDLDNLSASLKSGYDGLADAGVVANDSGLTHLPAAVEMDRVRPRVELLIRRT